MNITMQQSDDHEPRQRAEQILANPKTRDDEAYAYITLGCLCERKEKWEEAIANYARALGCLPEDQGLRYFGNNNFGYSLIQLGRFDEAEEYCEAAIEVDAERHNAHKNLGLSYQGQGRWLDAAFSFARAFRLNPADPRSWRHLEALLTARPQLEFESEELRLEVEQLREAIEGNGAARFH